MVSAGTQCAWHPTADSAVALWNVVSQRLREVEYRAGTFPTAQVASFQMTKGRGPETHGPLFNPVDYLPRGNAYVMEAWGSVLTVTSANPVVPARPVADFLSTGYVAAAIDGKRPFPQSLLFCSTGRS